MLKLHIDFTDDNEIFKIEAAGTTDDLLAELTFIVATVTNKLARNDFKLQCEYIESVAKIALIAEKEHRDNK